MIRFLKLTALAILALFAGCLIPNDPLTAASNATYGGGWRGALYLEPETVQLAPGDSVAVEAYYIKPNGDSLEVNDSTLFFILHEGGEMHGWPVHYYVAHDTVGTYRVWAEDRGRNRDYPPVGEMLVTIEAP